jgi:DnaJ-class molecular chaperone
MELRRCIPCGGSGIVMGSGMINKDCEYCYGSGKVIDESKIKVTLDKKSKHYKQAIKRC